MSSSRSSTNSKSPPGSSTSSTPKTGKLLSILNPQLLSDPPDLSVKVISAGGTSCFTPASPPASFEVNMKSKVRDRSRSPGLPSDEGELGVSEDSDRASWWGDSEKHVARPWYNPPKKKKTVPSEQIEALQSTRKVSITVKIVLSI